MCLNQLLLVEQSGGDLKTERQGLHLFNNILFIKTMRPRWCCLWRGLQLKALKH